MLCLRIEFVYLYQGNVEKWMTNNKGTISL